MRMWMIDPSLMCDKHLLGEHGEIHKFRPSFVKDVRITGRVYPVVQIEPASMKARHDELTAEMERRFGKSYDSPYEQPDLSAYSPEQVNARVDLNHNKLDMASRCPACFARMFTTVEERGAMRVAINSKYGA